MICSKSKQDSIDHQKERYKPKPSSLSSTVSEGGQNSGRNNRSTGSWNVENFVDVSNDNKKNMKIYDEEEEEDEDV